MSVAVDTRRPTEVPAAAAVNLVDDEHPWLGLDSFTEETRAFFHGREEEIAELARRVQRKTLAILFGQSGLGKTSILRAGIVPRLRREGFCPVYVRVDYSPDSPSPSEQIKQAIFRATEAQGEWTRPGSAVPGESLWEFLHHRDDYLQDAAGRTLTPLLIFDQFEEIFTLAQDDDFGRRRAAEFVEDLADLVENRAPKSLAVMLDEEEGIVERYDFDRADYRVLIALREDYLAHLEGFKTAMPSITQNRMRLARMTGQQALAAVIKPGGRLVTEEVAEAIVRFVAGGAELRNAEVEPSLLSLVCRELNNARVAQARAEISADLLAGSRDTILVEFYERALADQPEGVRRFIEDEMLTESGHRESLAEERVLRAFAAAGAAPGALAALVNRRLLRIEERLDMRRVELTHDVLCEVVKESREVRHEREAKQEAERQLAAQREREAATRRALVRARKIAAGCAVLAVVAVGGAAFGYLNMKRAQSAEALAERARGEAEKLIVFLLDDFYLELQPVGRLDLVGDLAKRSLDYYAGLPGELRTPETERNRALALVRYSLVLRYQAKLEEAEKAANEAVAVLSGLRSAGDRSEITGIGLALGYSAKATAVDNTARVAEARKHAEEAAGLLRSLMAGGSPSIPLRRAYGFVMNHTGFLQMRQQAEEEGERNLEAARAAYRSIAGANLENIGAAAGFLEATAWRMEALERLGRREESRRIGEEGIQVATRALEQRPGNMGVLRSRSLITSRLATMAGYEFDVPKSLLHARASAADWETFLKLDPGNAIAWNNLSSIRIGMSALLWASGTVQQAIEMAHSALEIERRGPLAPSSFVGLASMAAILAETEADLDNAREAQRMLGEVMRLTDVPLKAQNAPQTMKSLLLNWREAQAARVALASGRYEEARRLILPRLERLEALKGEVREVSARIHRTQTRHQHVTLAIAAYNLGDHAQAERAVRKAIESRDAREEFTLIPRVERSREQLLLALVLARQGRREEAAAIAAPEIRTYRSALAAGHDASIVRFMLAQSLYAGALASPRESGAMLAEAARLVDGLPAEMRRMRSVKQVREWIAKERPA